MVNIKWMDTLKINNTSWKGGWISMDISFSSTDYYVTEVHCVFLGR